LREAYRQLEQSGELPLIKSTAHGLRRWQKEDEKGDICSLLLKCVVVLLHTVPPRCSR
jgi:hypothetical protein